jgi:hypothetical protein
MDTLTTPVLLCCMATNSRKASVSIGLAKCYIGKATEKSVSPLRAVLKECLQLSPLRAVLQESVIQSPESEEISP